MKILNEEGLKKLAQELASQAKPEDVFCLEGELGAGKTTFAKHFIQHLCGKDLEVTSPTFGIVHCYNSKAAIWHFDLYRLKDKNELYEIGIEDAFLNAISLIEWPDVAKDLIDYSKTITVKISFAESAEQRIVEVLKSMPFKV